MLQRVNDSKGGRQPARSDRADRDAVPTSSRIIWWLSAIQSTAAGAVDLIGFLVFGGLFTSHIAGNLVVSRNSGYGGRVGG